MQCELCGRDFDCKPAAVDGVVMMLCSTCMKYGQPIQNKEIETSVSHKPPVLERIKKPFVKDIYKDVNMNKELVTGWNDIIKKAREKKKLTREELGFKIGERTVTISKIENGDLRPSDKIIEKLEKELGITLVENVADVHSGIGGTRTGSGYTIGDLIKKDK